MNRDEEITKGLLNIMSDCELEIMKEILAFFNEFSSHVSSEIIKTALNNGLLTGKELKKTHAIKMQERTFSIFEKFIDLAKKSPLHEDEIIFHSDGFKRDLH